MIPTITHFHPKLRSVVQKKKLAVEEPAKTSYNNVLETQKAKKNIMLIENCSLKDCRDGIHTDMGSNSMLIQIVDWASEFPKPRNNFKEVHQFLFYDAEDTCAYEEEFKISQEQANQLVKLLQHAIVNNMNVLVHCQMGLCRSGAVVEVGEMMGFTGTGRPRLPNVRVKTMMMRALGWTYN